MEKPIVRTSSTRDTGFRETTTFRNYYFNPETREVELVMTESNEDSFGKRNDYKHLELSREVLPPSQIPEEVRKEIEKIVGPL